MEKILVSACLCGLNTRYDGGHGTFEFLEKLRKYYEIVPFCPEVEGGLPTPRTRAEIIKGQVMTEDGKNVTKFYNAGADKALSLCHFLGIRIAILNDKSPSCGSRFIHDGSFKNNVIEGLGVTARALIADGIKVYSDKDALEFLLPQEDDKEKKRTKRPFSKTSKPTRSFKKDEGEEKPIRKRTFKKFDSDEKPARKRTFKKDWEGENKGSFEKKPFRKRSFEKKDEFKTEGRRPFRKRDDEKSFSEKRIYGKKRTFEKRDGEKSFGEKKQYGRKPYERNGEKRSFDKRGSDRKPFAKRDGFKGKPNNRSSKRNYGNKKA